MGRDIFERGVGYKLKRFVRGIRTITLSSFKTNILILVFLLALAVYGGYLLGSKWNAPAPSGMVTLSDALASKECPICEDCPECPVCPPDTFNASKCPAKNIIFFQCPDGRLVNDTSKCKVLPEITTSDFAYSDGFTISIDGISFVKENDENGLYRIKWINYTLLNEGDTSIVPQIEARVYDEWNSRVAAQYPQKVIESNYVLLKDSFLKESVVSRIVFTKLPKTVRLSLKNKMDDDGTEIVAVTTTLKD